MPVHTTDSDDRLVALAIGGDAAAVATLLERHLHPAWRIALAASASDAAAEAAVVDGFCDAVNAAGRHPESTLSLRTRIAAAVHAACVASGHGPRVSRALARHGDPVLAAFASLPTASRTALWLTEVEGGAPEQVAPVLGLDRSGTAALAERASATLRERIAADAIAGAFDPACAKALSKLPAHAAGKLTAADQAGVGEHVAGCGGCASLLASLVTPRAALRRLVVPIPAHLPGAVSARWLEIGGRDRSPLLRGWSERAVGAAAAAALAIGLGGALLLGRDGDRRTGPELAAPAGALDLPDDEDGGGALDVPDPLLAPVPPAPAGGSGVGVLASGGDRQRSTPPTSPGPARPPAESPAPAPTPPTAPPTTTTAPPPPAATDETSTVDLGVADVDLDEDPTVKVEVPGLPPVSLP